MSKITKITKGPIGALDIAWDESGSGEPFFFTGSDGKVYPNRKVGAGDIPVSQAVRALLEADNVDQAFQSIIAHFSGEALATETIAGIARIATSTEVTDGILDNAFVTPKKLKNLVATAAMLGLVKLATADDLVSNTNPDAVLTVKIAQNLGGLPAGIGPFPWYFPATPAGYVKADGALLSRTIFGNLWEACKGSAVADSAWPDRKTAFSSGDGATTFRVPDLRGLFMRGVDGGSGNDPDAGNRAGGNIPGSYQPDGTGSHRHRTGIAIEGSDVLFYGMENTGMPARRVRRGDSPLSSLTPLTDEGGGSESRPKNFAVHWIFKT